MQIKPTFDKKALERSIADAFVQFHLNNTDKTNYEFVCRPDEEHGGSIKLPDFEYKDKNGDFTQLIEMGRIMHMDTTRHMTIYKGFLTICEELERRVTGVYWLGVNHEKIQKAKTKKWTTYFAEMESAIERKAMTMTAGDNENIDGVFLQKFDDQGASFSLFSTNLSPLDTQNITWLVKLLQETGEKFTNYRMRNSRNILLLLQMETDIIKDEISVPIRLLKAGIYGKEHCSLPLFSGLYTVYVMFIEPFWDKEINLCQCYPHLVCVGLCKNSQIFKDIDDMHNSLKHYFPG